MEVVTDTTNAGEIIDGKDNKSDMLSDFKEILPLLSPGTSASKLSEASVTALLQLNDLPYPRSGHRVVANDKHLYVVGGYNPELWEQEQEGTK